MYIVHVHVEGCLDFEFRRSVCYCLNTKNFVQSRFLNSGLYFSHWKWIRMFRKDFMTYADMKAVLPLRPKVTWFKFRLVQVLIAPSLDQNSYIFIWETCRKWSNTQILCNKYLDSSLNSVRVCIVLKYTMRFIKRNDEKNWTGSICRHDHVTK